MFLWDNEYNSQMLEFSVVQKIVVWAIPVLFAITVHEVAHGWVAKQLGDPTAMMLGRLTLNPIKHIDPIGTIVVPLILLLLPGGFLFGWAKPVPVTWENLSHPKRDMAIVAIAGPVANLLMAILWVLVANLGLLLEDPQNNPTAIFLSAIGTAGILINIMLMVLNLLPLLPLDGGRVLCGLLPAKMSWNYSKLEPYGLLILIALLVTGLLPKILWPPIAFFLTLIANFAYFNPMVLGL